MHRQRRARAARKNPQVDWLETLFGSGQDLEPWQFATRAAAMFVIALVLLRISGKRSFGLKTPFDICTTVLFGAILGRGVSGASPFWGAVAAGVALVLMHRLVGLLHVPSRTFDR